VTGRVVWCDDSCALLQHNGHWTAAVCCEVARHWLPYAANLQFCVHDRHRQRVPLAGTKRLALALRGWQLHAHDACWRAGHCLGQPLQGEATVISSGVSSAAPCMQSRARACDMNSTSPFASRALLTGPQKTPAPSHAAWIRLVSILYCYQRQAQAVGESRHATLTDRYASRGMCCSSMHHWKLEMGALPLFTSVMPSSITTNWFFRLTCNHNGQVVDRSDEAGPAGAAWSTRLVAAQPAARPDAPADHSARS
jgi:hypothetical protein